MPTLDILAMPARDIVPNSKMATAKTTTILATMDINRHSNSLAATLRYEPARYKRDPSQVVPVGNPSTHGTVDPRKQWCCPNCGDKWQSHQLAERETCRRKCRHCGQFHNGKPCPRIWATYNYWKKTNWLPEDVWRLPQYLAKLTTKPFNRAPSPEAPPSERTEQPPVAPPSQEVYDELACVKAELEAAKAENAELKGQLPAEIKATKIKVAVAVAMMVVLGAPMFDLDVKEALKFAFLADILEGRNKYGIE
ncbi:hypothetical protein DE146DRAFT_770752 [Phaeosphaeria sp. MPI-PUGE-AT-0046c]|nr:hypothetical protein DE146DRAFT_770752 [Phaeosphaeria sp. MPI-PUGE-AT-0046c]